VSGLWAVLFPAEIYLATNPPLFYLFLWLMGRLGVSEAWLRFPSLLLGLLTVELSRRLALELGCTRRESWLAAALVACSPVAIEYSTDLSHYAALGALSTGSFLLLLRGLRSDGRWVWRGYFALCVVGFYTHYLFLFLGLSQVAFVAWYGWRRRGSGGLRTIGWYLRRGALAGLLVLPWLPVFVFSLHLGGLFKEDTRHYYTEAVGLPTYYGDLLREAAGLGPGLAWLTLVPLLLWGLGTLLHRRREVGTTALLLLPVLVVGLQLLSVYRMVTGYLQSGLYMPYRYLIPLLPLLAPPVAIAIFAALGWLRSQGLASARRVAAGALLVASALWLLAVVPSLHALVSRPQRPDLAGAAERVAGLLRDGDALVVLPAYSQADAFAWYLLGSMNTNLVHGHWNPITTADGEPGGWFYGPIADVMLQPVQGQLARHDFGRVLLVSVEEEMGGRDRFAHRRILEHSLETLSGRYAIGEEHGVDHVRILVLEAR
jgi:4-amino-4-deoxy-L-arabinose transferase-like glycosyltransferase